MYEINHKTLHELTVEDVETAAQENATIRSDVQKGRKGRIYRRRHVGAENL